MTTTSRRRPTLATRTQPKETSGTASPLWRRDGRAVPRDDLRLVRKDLMTGGVHTHLQPVHVIGAVRCVVAERFDAREVLDRAGR